MRTHLCRALLLLFVVAAVSGCTGGGGGGSTTSALSTSQDVSLSAFSGEVPSSGEEVALVHNPEPASMILFGLGALGLLRRKKIAVNQQNLKEEGGVK